MNSVRDDGDAGSDGSCDGGYGGVGCGSGGVMPSSKGAEPKQRSLKSMSTPSPPAKQVIGSHILVV